MSTADASIPEARVRCPCCGHYDLPAVVHANWQTSAEIPGLPDRKRLSDGRVTSERTTVVVELPHAVCSVGCARETATRLRANVQQFTVDDGSVQGKQRLAAVTANIGSPPPTYTRRELSWAERKYIERHGHRPGEKPQPAQEPEPAGRSPRRPTR
jgi:hypothetical protein